MLILKKRVFGVELIKSNRGGIMIKTNLTLPQISLIAMTRVVLGGGIALLFSDRLSESQRKAAGWALFLTGAATTIPLMKMVLNKRC